MNELNKEFLRCLLILFSLSAPCGGAYAQTPSSPGIPTLNILTDTSAETSDGMLWLRGTVSSGAQIKMTITNSTDHGVECTSTHNLVGAADGSVSMKGQMLSQGPGLYLIEIQVAQPGESTFTQLNEMKITNHTTVYTSPSKAVQSDAPEIVALANSITDGMTDDLTKAKAIHDWVATHITYDFLPDHTPNLLTITDAVGVLKAGKSICYGYSNLYAALARASGLTVRVVGSAIHAWNEVLIADQWTSVDTTWDATPVGTPANETYFNTVFSPPHPLRAAAIND
jgi:hypothetical protein